MRSGYRYYFKDMVPLSKLSYENAFGSDEPPVNPSGLDGRILIRRE